MRTAGESLRVNFGQQEFASFRFPSSSFAHGPFRFCFDIQHFVEERREQYYDSILNSSIRSSYLDDTDAARNEKQSQLEQAENLQNSSRPTSPRLETTLAKLVSSYLNFHAHLDTAEAFEKEREASMANLRGIQGQASATSMAVDEDSSNDNVESLESRRCRRSILEAVKAGRHLEARQIVKEQYHEALESTGASGLPLDFQLRSRHFLETVLNTSAGSSSMGMDLDSISAKSAGKETEAGPVESSSTVDAVLDDLLLFGQELHRDYGSSKDTRITSMLMSLSSLLAYTNPREATDTDIQSLILEAGQAGRESLATEVNGTLLSKPSLYFTLES